MDGATIATIVVSSVAVAGAIGGGFWKLGRAIGRLEGKVDGFNNRVGAIEDRVVRQDERINQIVESGKGDE